MVKKQLNIIKIGGNVIDNEVLLLKFLTDFSQIKSAKGLVHGGGKIATQIASKLNIETKMVDGRRITDEPMLEVVTMVYGGLVNKQIVAKLQAQNCNAIGLTGADGGVILAKKRPVKTIDYGFVGDIEQVNAQFIDSILNQGISPVFAPLTFDSAGFMLNTNADTQASAVAVAMAESHEVQLVYCFEKKGVLSDPNNDDSVIGSINPAQYEELKAAGAIHSGMIPKLDNAFAALGQGVRRVIICHANELLEAVAAGTAGTRLEI
jgi:acetylglutamate kinase